MTHGDWLYLDLVLATFAGFMAVLAYGSWRETAAARLPVRSPSAAAPTAQRLTTVPM